MSHLLHLEQFGPVHALPVLHYRMEFACLVREAVAKVQPDCIAIELPPTIESKFLRSLQRLPEISVLTYQINIPGLPKGVDASVGKRSVYLLIEPADPLVEAARLAMEQQLPLHLVDLDLDGYPLHEEPLPDSYAVQRLGLASYYQEFLGVFSGVAPGSQDLRREKGMAFRLQQLAGQYQRILFVCGMYHLERIKEFFGQPQVEPLGRVKRGNVRLYNLHPESCREILAEYPFLSAIYEQRREDYAPEQEETRDLSLRKRYHALELLTGGKSDVPEAEVLARSISKSIRYVGDKGEMVDRQRVMLRLFLEAARHYRQETGEKIHHWQKRAFFRFARNCALLDNLLLPDLYHMLAAARGCLDDNFAYAFFRLATCYPWQKELSDLPTIRLTHADLWQQSRNIRFRPRARRRGKGLGQLAFLNRKREKRPGEWLEGFDDPAICSYPPEDLVIEDYGQFLKKIGAKQLSEEQSRVEPFTASMLDGIDMRETLRNLHEGRIYVRKHERIKGGVGSVVVVFDEDRGGDSYPYLMTWLGEHAQESDMAFYATDPSGNISGPGISRCEYGGFVLCYPPRRMLDVWSDNDYSFARSKSEVLLLAALDYSPEMHVVYVAPRPPRSYFRQLAARLGKKIVYLPLGSLSPVRLKKLRVFHVLFGRDKRDIAKDYIW
jgi:hypothetical protein